MYCGSFRPHNTRGDVMNIKIFIAGSFVGLIGACIGFSLSPYNKANPCNALSQGMQDVTLMLTQFPIASQNDEVDLSNVYLEIKEVRKMPQILRFADGKSREVFEIKADSKNVAEDGTTYTQLWFKVAILDQSEVPMDAWDAPKPKENTPIPRQRIGDMMAKM